MAENEWQGTVGAQDAGLRLDVFLADHLGSRARAARLIAAGLVAVDGRAVQKRHPVAVGEVVVVQVRRWEHSRPAERQSQRTTPSCSRTRR